MLGLLESGVKGDAIKEEGAITHINLFGIPQKAVRVLENGL